MVSRRAFLQAMGVLGAAGLAGCAPQGGQVSPGQGTLVGVMGSGQVDGTATEVTAAGARELVQVPLDGEELGMLNDAHVSPDPASAVGTVLAASVTPRDQQRLFLWEEGNVPAVTEDTGSGRDPIGFRPTITSVPVPRGTGVRGAVLLCAGGAFQFRGDNADCYPTAAELAQRGYQCFVVDYRLRPFTQQEGALDLARAVRFVRSHARAFELPDERCIAIGGFSAGGILCGEELLNWKGLVAPDALDPSYVPDGLDAVSADVAADAMIYSFYGRLSVASTDAEALRAGDLPPTYYCYGTRDPFYDQFEAQVQLMADVGYTVRARVLDGWPHGFGALGGWIPEFDAFMQEAFAR